VYLSACTFADLKWPGAAATTRPTNAEALAKVTIAIISGTRGQPDGTVLRHALNRWVFSSKRPNSSEGPAEVRRVLQRVEKNTRNVSSLAHPQTLHPLLKAIRLKLDTKPDAAVWATAKATCSPRRSGTRWN